MAVERQVFEAYHQAVAALVLHQVPVAAGVHQAVLGEAEGLLGPQVAGVDPGEQQLEEEGRCRRP